MLRSDEAVVGSNDHIIIVDKVDLIDEPKGINAGRPRLKKYNPNDIDIYLMTREQVEKMLDVKRRFEVVTPRQRRANIAESDLFPFFTINRDDVAIAFRVGQTWFKETCQELGISHWPARPLRRSGAELEELKDSPATARAAARFSHIGTAGHIRNVLEIALLEDQIEQKIEARVNIFKQHVSGSLYNKFMQTDRRRYLSPTWDSLPPKFFMEEKRRKAEN